MKHSFYEKNGRVVLQPLSIEGAEKMRQLRNENSSSFFNHSAITREGQQRWYQNYLIKPDDYMFSVYLLGTGQWVGAVGIYNVDFAGGTAEFGRLLIEKKATDQRGLGVDVTEGACNIAFEQLGVSCIYLEVYEDNIPAVKTYERAGFLPTHKDKDAAGKNIITMIRKR